MDMQYLRDRRRRKEAREFLTEERIRGFSDSPGMNLYVDELGSATTVLEYGAGQSTAWGSRFSKAEILSVESDPQWVREIERLNLARTRIIYCNLGKIKKRGRPRGKGIRENFYRYASIPYDNGFRPDLVLVDGRLRVLCFLVTLLRCEPGTRIVFDDYVDRPNYHEIEAVAEPLLLNARQALFVRPDHVDSSTIKEMIGRYQYVLD